MITFLDIEYDKKNRKIYDFGAVNDLGKTYHNTKLNGFLRFIKGSDFYCGHNIINHDSKYINIARGRKVIEEVKCIDTLLLSVLLFPNKPYHKLIKDDKLKPEDSNNPLNDSINSQALFADEKYMFSKLPVKKQEIFYELLKDVPGFTGFFSCIKFVSKIEYVEKSIKDEYYSLICSNANVSRLINEYPVELALTLALSATKEMESLFPKWVLYVYPMVEHVMLTLRGVPCSPQCEYCKNNLNPLIKTKSLFGFDSFREFDGLPLQELAIDAALKNKSLIAVFPTGGGKSFTYQLPALMRGDTTRSLTVIISPLQSLMKDQVDNLQSKSINKSVALYGLLDPIERAKNIRRVKDGEVSILYIAPESLRSRTIERLLLSRDIARFVIDEAHCFSSWGQDFRVDYLYIGEFIKNLQEKKSNNKQIPVSCFTATAKKNVVKDIEDYFMEKLNITMEKITSSSARKNLTFKVKNIVDETEKYRELRSLLDTKNVPTIIYASRVKKVSEIFNRLQQDQYSVSMFHGKMESDEKILSQNSFMSGETRIMVATSAFGMGVDKDDVGRVIHFDISSSLENYVQEAGRAGRKKDIKADCYILYNEEDLDKHFNLLNSTKLNIMEIKQIWTGIKRNVSINRSITKSALEIAKDAGWEDNVRGLETRVKTAVAALEDAGYIQRGLNSPRVFADGILSKNQAEAVIKIDKSSLFNEKEKVIAKRITSNLISSKFRKRSANDESEARVDYLAEVLGLRLDIVIEIIGKLREEKILADSKDLACFLKGAAKQSSKILSESIKLERFLISEFSEENRIFNFKELNEKAIESGLKSNVKMIKDVVNYLNINKIIALNKMGIYKIKVDIKIEKHLAVENLDKKSVLSAFILEFLYRKRDVMSEEDKNIGAILFSVHELKSEYAKNSGLFNAETTIKDIEEALYFMKIVESIKIEGGFLVIYSPMNIKRLNNGNIYKKSDYEKLSNFYTNKVEQIHIVGEYAKKMAGNYVDALQFVNDYFNMDYKDFLSLYFKGNRKKEISKKVSPSKFKQLFGELSPSQLEIINDKDSDIIVVAAGPGSGKTRLLVHKLAAITLMEDTRPDQMLMLTFSRAAVNEFKSRLLDLLGPIANGIEIKTFHSFCFDIIGRVGTLDKSAEIISDAINMIEEGEVDPIRITKTMLVIDEAQDMVEKEYQLINLLLEKNEDIKLIAVGDDDQNIYEFRKSSNKYLKEIANVAKLYELPHNYRSKKNIIEFSNRFVSSISGRMKQIPILNVQKDNGNIVIVEHIETNLYEPIVKHLDSCKFDGSTAILTRTNEQASVIAGMLCNQGKRAMLIQDNSEMNLFNFFELRKFYNILTSGENISVVGKENWRIEKRRFLNDNTSNPNIIVFKNALDTFEKFNSRIKYLSDFKEFLKESSYDDFIPIDSLVVSTLHKSKGREFDNVFILFDNKYISNNPTKRLLYVGMTRARNNLVIHCSNDKFKYEDIENFEYYNRKKIYEMPDKLVFTLTHKGLDLGYFEFTQKAVDQIKISTPLTLIENWRLINGNSKILKFSKKQVEYMDELLDSGYKFESARVKHKVYWYNLEKDIELVIALPEITFAKVIKEEVKEIINVQDKSIKHNEKVAAKIEFNNWKSIHDYITENISLGVCVNIVGHKSLTEGSYEVIDISDYYKGSHEGKHYFSVNVLSDGKKIGVGCKCIEKAIILKLI